MPLTSGFQAKFGFVAFSDPEDFLKAWKEMDGEYLAPSGAAFGTDMSAS